MNLSKSLEFFNPTEINQPVRIIGCGAIGSNVAIQLARLGINNIHLYDFDIVNEHNIANQHYDRRHLLKHKTTALDEQIQEINHNCTVTKHTDGWKEGMNLTGHIFLCVDDIDLRRQIITENRYNLYINTWHDFRMRLSDAQYYFANAKQSKQILALLNSMDFSHDEAKEATPISACGTTLNVIPTVWNITAVGVANFLNHIKQEETCLQIHVDTFIPTVLGL